MSEAPRRRWMERLDVRLAFLLSLALLPVGLVAVLQSRELLSEAQARAEAALMGETARAAAPELRLIQRAEAAAEALASAVATVADDAAACSEIMRDLVERSDVYSFAGFYDTSGQMVCSSAGRSFDFGDSPALQRSLADPRPRLNINRDAPMSGTSVFFATYPLQDETGTLIGFVSVSIPHRTLAIERVANGQQGDLALMTFNRDGEVLTSSVGLEWAENLIPKDRSLAALAGTDGVAFTATGADGEERVYSVLPLVPGDLYALGTLRAGEASRALRLNPPLPAFLFPALMWLVSLVVALAATQQQVTRHIRKLGAALTSFSGGKRIVSDLDMKSAPVELREIAAAYERMTETILHDEAELENMVHQKEVLLREVHHRVKNNLQLIASIVSLQMRKATSPEAKGLLKNLQDRVMGLATIHKGLYQTSGQADIRADELLPDIVRQVVKISTGGGRKFDVRTEFDEIHLTPDQAVPLSLLLTEALTNAMKYGGIDESGNTWLAVSLRREGGSAVTLDVANSIGDASAVEIAQDGESTGLGSHLLEAFAQQLGGSIVKDDAGDGAYRLRVTFVPSLLSEAEDSVAEPVAEAV